MLPVDNQQLWQISNWHSSFTTKRYVRADTSRWHCSCFCLFLFVLELFFWFLCFFVFLFFGFGLLVFVIFCLTVFSHAFPKQVWRASQYQGQQAPSSKPHPTIAPASKNGKNDKKNKKDKDDDCVLQWNIFSPLYLLYIALWYRENSWPAGCNVPVCRLTILLGQAGGQARSFRFLSITNFFVGCTSPCCQITNFLYCSLLFVRYTILECLIDHYPSFILLEAFVSFHFVDIIFRPHFWYVFCDFLWQLLVTHWLMVFKYRSPF